MRKRYVCVGAQLQSAANASLQDLSSMNVNCAQMNISGLKFMYFIMSILHIHDKMLWIKLYCTQPPPRGDDQVVMPTPRGRRLNNSNRSKLLPSMILSWLLPTSLQQNCRIIFSRVVLWNFHNNGKAYATSQVKWKTSLPRSVQLEYECWQFSKSQHLQLS